MLVCYLLESREVKSILFVGIADLEYFEEMTVAMS
jgi:hypothetical protein